MTGRTSLAALCRVSASLRLGVMVPEHRHAGRDESLDHPIMQEEAAGRSESGDSRWRHGVDPVILRQFFVATFPCARVAQSEALLWRESGSNLRNSDPSLRRRLNRKI